MRRPGTVQIGPFGLIAAAIGGTWLAHNIEYARIWGVGGFAGASVKSAHAYMGPTGVVLLGVALAGVLGTLWTARRLRGELKRAGDGGPTPTPIPRHITVDVATLAGIVWVWQLVLWTIEENIEIHLAGGRAPGLSVLWGQHVLAPVIHLVVAAVVAIAIWRVRRPVAELVEALRAARERWNTSRQTGAAPAPVVVSRTWTPAERWGRLLWSRPPPAGAATNQ